jgi:hypothetical protein
MRKIAYVVSTIILTGCGGGGGDSPSPSPTANNTPVSPTNVVEQPYFTEVQNAFPDPTNHYWFFNTAIPSSTNIRHDVHAARVVGSTAVDLDNDGKLEFLMTFDKGIGADQYNKSYVSVACKSLTVIYELNAAGKFVDASEKYIDGTRDSQSCSGHFYSLIDINNDGRKDIFYSTNQSDGRSSDAGSDMNGYVVGYISQPNGRLKMQKLGPSKYYGSIGHGIDYYGKAFVTAAGYPNDLGTYRQNHKYMWNGSAVEIVYNGILPGMSPVSFNFYSTDKKSSNRLIQQSHFHGHLGAQGFYMENGSWHSTNHVNPDMKLLGSSESLTNYAGDKKRVDVYEYKGKHILGGSVGLTLENLCTINNGNGEPYVAGINALAVLKDSYVPGKPLTMNDFYTTIEYVGFHIEDKKLYRDTLNIHGEDNFNYGKMQCIDVNRDGHDDLVMSIGPGQTNEISRIYINQKDKSFKKLDIGDLSKFTLNKDVDKHMSEMADFDGDGIMDIIVYPDNVLNNKPLNGAIKFYKGTKSIQ